MVQNLKVDIIYHLTASDFEMEFNLCGCCRMRLLSDKTTDKKSFVKALARGVARSRVIMACGPLFGADGLISTVATAIGNGLTLCDNKTYGINGEEPIHIINGSTPLVTPNGYFGGCIIESGPQTIILLTENKAFRKEIMQNLIHPYIEEISYIPTKSSPLSPQPVKSEPVFETAVSEEENYLIQDDDYQEELIDSEPVISPMPNEHNVEFIMDGGPEPEPSESDTPEPAPNFDDGYNIMYTETEKPEDIKSHYSESYTPSQSDSMFIASREVDETEKKQKSKKNMRTMDITIVILVLLLLLAILALVYLIVLKPMTMGISTGEYLKEIFGTASNSTLV
ncbi:MAG: hypothetical protein IJY79_07000 [Clostridia bacterium]|nr:hypothetical protein [Clostridia bacterium]